MSGRDLAERCLKKAEEFMSKGDYYAAEGVFEAVFNMKTVSEQKIYDLKNQSNVVYNEQVAIYRKLQGVLEKIAGLTSSNFSSQERGVTFDTVAQFQNWWGIATGTSELSQVLNTYVAELAAVQQKHATLTTSITETEVQIREIRMACSMILPEYDRIVKHIIALLGNLAAIPASSSTDDRPVEDGESTANVTASPVGPRLSVNGKRLGRPPKVRPDDTLAKKAKSGEYHSKVFIFFTFFNYN